jgi:hypothetical protein
MAADARFYEYAMAFEETYKDDDWKRLEPYFAEDAVYEVRSKHLGCVVRGRDAVLRALKKSIDGFDRRMGSRRVEVTGAPSTEGDTVSIPWAASYEYAGAPRLRFEGRSIATVKGPHITHLVDEYTDEEAQRMADWVTKHAPDLDASYV